MTLAITEIICFGWAPEFVSSESPSFEALFRNGSRLGKITVTGGVLVEFVVLVLLLSSLPLEVLLPLEMSEPFVALTAPGVVSFL